eukprot:scaffold33708_cov96-Isochrysis_galbana.AAC.1
MAPHRPGTQPTEADPTLDIGAKRARVVGDDESSTQVRLRARACNSLHKPACTISAHILAWLLLALAVCAQRKFASKKGRECSKDTFGCRSTLAAPPFNTSASAVQYQSPSPDDLLFPGCCSGSGCLCAEEVRFQKGT